MRLLKASAIALSMGLVSAFALADDHPPTSLEDVVKMLKAQQEEIEALKAELQALLNTPELVELLALEMEAEKLELDMGKALFPFTELSRLLSNKRIYLDEVKGVADLDELPSLRETVRVSVPQAFVSI